MATEPANKKTMRHFYCRDLLWEAFEEMATDFDCSIDYLINEAMQDYAVSRKQAQGVLARSVGGGGDAPTPVPVQRSAPAAAEAGAPWPPAVPSQPPRSNLPPLPPLGPGVVVSPSRPPVAPPVIAGGLPSPMAALPPVEGSAPIEPAAGATLYLLFRDQKIAIQKEQFIIGRGSRTSDLPIKDGNISRKHAAVIRKNGTYFIKDLGSTNGIDHKGMRIDNKRIDEGDVFHLCDYELRFTYLG